MRYEVTPHPQVALSRHPREVLASTLAGRAQGVVDQRGEGAVGALFSAQVGGRSRGGRDCHAAAAVGCDALSGPVAIVVAAMTPVAAAAAERTVQEPKAVAGAIASRPVAPGRAVRFGHKRPGAWRDGVAQAGRTRRAGQLHPRPPEPDHGTTTRALGIESHRHGQDGNAGAEAVLSGIRTRTVRSRGSRPGDTAEPAVSPWAEVPPAGRTRPTRFR